MIRLEDLASHQRKIDKKVTEVEKKNKTLTNERITQLRQTIYLPTAFRVNSRYPSLEMIKLPL